MHSRSCMSRIQTNNINKPKNLLHINKWLAYYAQIQSLIGPNLENLTRIS